MNKIKVWGGSVLAAAAVTACGGDLIAVLGALGAAGGAYTRDANPATAALETIRSEFFDQVQFISITVDGSNDGPLGQNFFDETFPVTASGSLGNVVCTNTKGRVNGDRLELEGCFQGRFENVNRVVSDDGRFVLRFDNFSPTMESGIWVDIQDTSRRIKFRNDDSTGCEYKNGNRTANAVSLVQKDSNSSTGALDRVEQFRIGDRVWATGEYVGASGLRLTGTPGTLELERRRDTDPPTPCP